MKLTKRLELTASSRATLVRLSEAAYPHEGCGVLIGVEQEGGVRVVEVTHANNLNRERAHDRYELDPADLLSAELHAVEQNAEVIGIWHTHPDHPAEPSETDRQAAWEGWSYVIVSVESGRVARIRSWRLDRGTFYEEDIQS